MLRQAVVAMRTLLHADERALLGFHPTALDMTAIANLQGDVRPSRYPQGIKHHSDYLHARHQRSRSWSGLDDLSIDSDIVHACLRCLGGTLQVVIMLDMS